MADTTLSNAIEQAANELANSTLHGDTKDEKVVNTPEVTIEAEESTEEPEEESEEAVEIPEGLSKDELEEAQRLYKALKDPKLSRQVVAALAADAGLLQGNQTKKEEAVAKKAIREIIKDTLPNDYKFLAEALGPAIEAAFESQKEEQSAEFQKIELRELENQVAKVLTEISKETKGESQKLERKMVQLMGEMPPSNSIPLETYVRRIYLIASGGKRITSTNTDRVRRNLNDVGSRARTSSTIDTKEKIPEFTGKGALNKAVEFAVKQQQEKK